MDRKVNIFINFNESNDKAPKLWAYDTNGTVYWTSSIDSPITQVYKGLEYCNEFQNIKMRKGFNYVAEASDSFFDNTWPLVLRIWQSENVTQSDIVELSKNEEALIFFKGVKLTRPTRKFYGSTEFISKIYNEAVKLMNTSKSQNVTNSTPVKRANFFIPKITITDRNSAWSW